MYMYIYRYRYNTSHMKNNMFAQKQNIQRQMKMDLYKVANALNFTGVGK